MGRELLVGTEGGNAPLRLVSGRRLWLRFGGRGWSAPTTANPAVAGLRFVRCPSGDVVAQVRAIAEGVTELHATLPVGDAAFEWVQMVTVSHHRLPSRQPPAESRMIRAGGMLVYPQRLYEAGAAMQFAVPPVECPPGQNSHTTIGLFGITHFTPSYQGVAQATWSAGLAITCTAPGTPTFSVGYNGDAQEGHPQPGDIVYVSTSGGGCPSMVIGFRQPHPRSGALGMSGGPGCAIGPHYQIRAITQPTLMLGADVHGPTPRIDLTIRSVSINGQPYRMAPHRFRQLSNGYATVRTNKSADWYRLNLRIENSTR